MHTRKTNTKNAGETVPRRSIEEEKGIRENEIGIKHDRENNNKNINV